MKMLKPGLLDGAGEHEEDFDESKHPRDGDGEFTDGSGSKITKDNVQNPLTTPTSSGTISSYPKPFSKETGLAYNFTKGTRVTGIIAFAGKGTQKELRVAEYLSKTFGADAKEWQHVRGSAYIDNKGNSDKVEIHWFEASGVKPIKVYIKRWLK